MSESRGLGFGGFLIGLGAGWIYFRNYTVDYSVFSWLLILLGASIIVSSILPHLVPNLKIGGLLTGLTIGVILGMIISSGFSITPWSIWSDSYPNSVNTYSNFTDTVVADRILFEAINVNGGFTLSEWDEDGYLLSARIRARGRTEDDAQSNMDKVGISLNDVLDSGTQELELLIDVPTGLWNRINVEVTLYIPTEVMMDLELSTTNGGIHLESIQGGEFNVDTTNGDLEYTNILAETVTGSTTNGDVSGKVEATDFFGRTTNGQIELTIPSTMTGTYTLTSTNGGIDVQVSQTEDNGFNLDSSVSNGGVDFTLDGLDYSVNTAKSKKATTDNWTSADIQIEITASTTNGNIDINN